jgi:hypothetical protein
VQDGIIIVSAANRVEFHHASTRIAQESCLKSVFSQPISGNLWQSIHQENQMMKIKILEIAILLVDFVNNLIQNYLHKKSELHF